MFSSAASLICLIHWLFFGFSLSPLYFALFWLCFELLWFLSSLGAHFTFFFNLIQKKSYLLLHHLPSHHSPLLFFCLPFPPFLLVKLWVNKCNNVHNFSFLFQSSHWNQSWPIRFWREAEWGSGCRQKKFLPMSPTNFLPTTRNCLELM